MDKKVQISREGFEKLKAERENLINVERPAVIEEIKLARSQGDLSENADYDAARDKQARIEERIKELEVMMQNAVIIGSDVKVDTHVVNLGATVTVLDLSEENPEPDTLAIDQLLDDIEAGRKYMKVYRQMKMYNDPSTNPVLYKK